VESAAGVAASGTESFVKHPRADTLGALKLRPKGYSTDSDAILLDCDRVNGVNDDMKRNCKSEAGQVRCHLSLALASRLASEGAVRVPFPEEKDGRVRKSQENRYFLPSQLNTCWILNIVRG